MAAIDIPEPESISITVCGDGGTGKSSISLRLVRSKWTHEYDPTVQDSYSVTRVVDGRTFHLNLTGNLPPLLPSFPLFVPDVRKRKYPRWKKGLTPRAKDTAGQEEYRGLWASQNLKSDAYLLVYDITSRHSLSALDYFNDLIEIEAGAADEYGGGNAVPHIKIVAGNKCDLADVRQVSAEEGLRWARDHECGFMETSARNMVNIEETFALLVRRVVEAREAAKTGGRARSRGGDTVRSKRSDRGAPEWCEVQTRGWCCIVM